jgi:hypothetical protein
MLLQEVRVSSMSFWTLAGSDCRTDDEGWAATDENVYAPVVRAVATRSVFFIQSLLPLSSFLIALSPSAGSR